MRAHGLRGVSRRKWTRTTLRDGAETPEHVKCHNVTRVLDRPVFALPVV